LNLVGIPSIGGAKAKSINGTPVQCNNTFEVLEFEAPLKNFCYML